ncbi:MAG: NeuD/PglB/VioB family sugar acetyltransferase [Fimbriimonadaceae bacterium]
MKLSVVGGGGHSREVISAARASGLTPHRILSDDSELWGEHVMGVPIVGGIDLLEPGEAAHIAIGSNLDRQKIARAFPEVDWITIIHPFSWVCPSSVIAKGCLISAGVVVQSEVQIGDHVIVNVRASISHECILEDFCQVAPGAAVGGRVKVGKRAFVGIGSSVHQGSQLGDDAVLGGSAFLKGTLPECETWVGIPARSVYKR